MYTHKCIYIYMYIYYFRNWAICQTGTFQLMFTETVIFTPKKIPKNC